MTDKTSWTEPRRLMTRPVFMGIQSDGVRVVGSAGEGVYPFLAPL